MEIVTSWQRQGRIEGKQEEACTIVMRLLNRRVGGFKSPVAGKNPAAISFSTGRLG